MIKYNTDSLLDFYQDKKILITGHTGFKGAWMCKVLEMAKAKVVGYSLQPPTNPNLFDLAVDKDVIYTVIGDIRDYANLLKIFQETQPEIVIHMAAQPLVRESYREPRYTYETNVMGAVNVLECIRNTCSVKSFVNVTTDKVYLNKEWLWGYRENEELNGYDPYSNSKSCSELVTSSYLNSFFKDSDVAITTCRAGNVIGGGDFATDRIIPDCIRSAISKEEIIVRNPFSTRPYQHVLEPVVAYLIIAKSQYENKQYASNYNIGPNDSDYCTTGQLVDVFCKAWNAKTNTNVSWVDKFDEGPHEANCLRLDCSKVKNTFGWQPKWDVCMAMDKIVEWTIEYIEKKNLNAVMRKQIAEYLELSVCLGAC